MDIGLRIKELRTKNNLTLEELAARSELTKGFLSQLERNLTSPSIATLDDILEALGTNLSEFFKESKNQKNVFKEEDFYINEKDGATTKFVVPNAQKNEMEPIILKLNSQAMSNIIPPHEGEEFGFVLKGQLVFHNGIEQHELSAGETFYISGKHEHYIENISREEAELLWVITPPNF